MEQFRKNDKTPFNRRLVHANFETDLSNIKTLNGDESRIIRTVSIEKLLEFDSNVTQLLDNTDKVAYIQDKLTKARELLTEFAQESNVVIPRFNYVLGERAPKAKLPGPTLYTEVERVSGECIGVNIEKGSTDIPKEAVEQLIASLFVYNTQKLIDEEPFLSDISRLDQFMYGSSMSHLKPGVFLVDVDPLFDNFELAKDEHYLDGYYVYLMNQLFSSVRQSEKLYKAPFSYARSVLTDCLNSIAAAYPKKRTAVEEWRSYL